MAGRNTSSDDVRVNSNQDKALKCPDAACDFRTCDPGSLTRHRKRAHNYQPRSRNYPSSGRITTQKMSNRAAPYPRRGSTSSSSFSDLSQPSLCSDREAEEPAYEDATPPPLYGFSYLDAPFIFPPTPPPTLCSDSDLSFPIGTALPDWTDFSFAFDQFTELADGLVFVASKPQTPDLPQSPDPKNIVPAFGTSVLEEIALSKYWAAMQAATLSLRRRLRRLSCPSTPPPRFNPEFVNKLKATLATQPSAIIPFASPVPAATVPTTTTQRFEDQQLFNFDLVDPVVPLSPLPLYAIPRMPAPQHQPASWSLDEHLNGAPTMGLPASELPLTASWDQLYAPAPSPPACSPAPATQLQLDLPSLPSPFGHGGCDYGYYDYFSMNAPGTLPPASPVSSLSSDDFVITPVTNQELEAFLQAC